VGVFYASAGSGLISIVGSTEWERSPLELLVTLIELESLIEFFSNIVHFLPMNGRLILETLYLCYCYILDSH